MNVCSICGKQIVPPLQGTITYTITVTNKTTTDPCWIVPADVCMGHTTLTASTGTIRLQQPLQPMPQPKREPVPSAFQDAFEGEEDLWTL